MNDQFLPQVTALIDAYCEVWSESDPFRRAERLAEVWALDAMYTDPMVHAVGRAVNYSHILARCWLACLAPRSCEPAASMNTTIWFAWRGESCNRTEQHFPKGSISRRYRAMERFSALLVSLVCCPHSNNKWRLHKCHAKT